MSDRKLDAPIATPLAKSGMLVASPDFRTPVELSYPGRPEDGAGAMRFYIENARKVVDLAPLPGTAYPAQIVDVNYGIRWLKSRARDFNISADRVG